MLIRLGQLHAFSQLLEHHQQREEQALLVELADALGDESWGQLTRALDHAWEQSLAAAGQRYRQWLAQLPAEHRPDDSDAH